MAFEYHWDSTSSPMYDDPAKSSSQEIDAEFLDLDHCYLYEMTTYAYNSGTYRDGYFIPPDPPFNAWRFRDPTDGRTAPVALGCFAASQGWAWDRHKLGGKLSIPESSGRFPKLSYTISAIQQYRFFCERCGLDTLVPGPSSGPHAIVRTFAPLMESVNAIPDLDGSTHSKMLWRYRIQKHNHAATLDITSQGEYADDSAHLGFGPW